MSAQTPEVLVIGAGPAGALAAVALRRRGHAVRIVERQRFPRFSIGESLLAQTLALIDEAGLLDAVCAGGFQFKNGASFTRGAESSDFNFAQKTAAGPGYTFQVPRAEFDQLLANEAAALGARIDYEMEVVAARFESGAPELRLRAADGREETVRPAFVLDASGFGRTLPKLLDLERPSALPPRRSLFTHVRDAIPAGAFDRQKVRIAIHPTRAEVWYWLIPFSDGRASVGVVLPLDGPAPPADGLDDALFALIREEPGLARLLAQAEPLAPVRQIAGYSAKAASLHGDGWALLGNAAEFLDPVFSSGVTIAIKSAQLAADALDRQLRGEAVDWDADYSQALMFGVETFRGFVECWYDGSLQDVIFFGDKDERIRRMICSVLAGYAWDRDNPYAGPQSGRRLRALATICRG